MSHGRAVSVLLLWASSLLMGCGHAQPPATATPGSNTLAAAPPAREAGAAPSDVIRRSTIRSVLAAGPGAFLQKVSVDDHPVFSAGRFHGFRITALEAESFRGVDLQPGDVVTRIEGMPIEHPEEAIAAFDALQVASELRVDYERDGVPRMLRYRIVDDDAPAPAPPAAPAKPGK
jgi:type II secretory pathway component PulC